MGRAYHTYWEVVDPDPNGLNCRMTNSSFEELMRAENRTPFEFFNWSLVGVLKQGQRFESFPSNAAGTFNDTLLVQRKVVSFALIVNLSNQYRCHRLAYNPKRVNR